MPIHENSLTVTTGLVRIVNADLFQRTPRGDGAVHVVVMRKTGRSPNHYCTLRSAKDKLSVGEDLLGSYVCYIVSLDRRSYEFRENYLTRDRVTQAPVTVKLSYHAHDGDEIVLFSGDGLQYLKDEIVKYVRRWISNLTLEQIDESRLENELLRNLAPLAGQYGLSVEKTDVSVDWPAEMIERRRALIEERRRQQAEDDARRRKQAIEDEERRRQQEIEDKERARQRENEIADRRHLIRLDEQDFERINRFLAQLNMERLPPELVMRLYAMPRDQALHEIIEWIEMRRQEARAFARERSQRDHELLMRMIEENIVQAPDIHESGLADHLLKKYQDDWTYNDLMKEADEALPGFSYRKSLSDAGSTPAESASSEEPSPDSKDSETPEADQADAA